MIPFEPPFDLGERERLLIQKICTAADEQVIEAYLVGGFVRDKLLGRPTKDIDVVVVGSGIEFAHKVANYLKPTPKVNYYSRYGTAMLRYEGIEVEFVGARKESYARESRNPMVEEGTLLDDQNRRDFTINALACSLQRDSAGQLIDPFGGMEDLRLRRIRTPLDPNKTFDDDPLRMLRAIRFASQLGFDIVPDTLEAIRRHKDRIDIVSQERITSELEKIIGSPKPSVGLKLLFETGLLQIVFPELYQMYGVEVVEGKAHKDNFYHTLEVLDNVASKSDHMMLRWSALLHDIAKPQTKRYDPKVGWTFHGHEVLGASMAARIFKRLRLPLDAKLKYVQKLIRLHLRPISLTKDEITDSAIRRLLVDAGNELEDLMLLCEADITSKNREKKLKYAQNYRLVREKIAQVAEKDRLRNWQPPIDGEDIMKAFGIKPGRDVGVIKQRIRDAILDGIIPDDREAALAMMLEVGQELGLGPKEENFF